MADPEGKYSVPQTIFGAFAGLIIGGLTGLALLENIEWQDINMLAQMKLVILCVNLGLPVVGACLGLYVADKIQRQGGANGYK